MFPNKMPFRAKEVNKINNRNKGDALGEIDQDGIAQWYPNCKVRKEGDYYIATPHTTNPTKRTVRKPKEIAVSLKDGKYALEKPQDKPLKAESAAVEQSPSKRIKVRQSQKNSRKRACALLL